MLARAMRLRTADEFRDALRRGRRCSARTISIHALFDDSDPPPRIGLIVTKSVGIAVRRNRVKRRLRAALHGELPRLPGGLLVIRAFPTAAAADFSTLSADVSRCVDRLKTERT